MVHLRFKKKLKMLVIYLRFPHERGVELTPLDVSVSLTVFGDPQDLDCEGATSEERP